MIDLATSRQHQGKIEKDGKDKRVTAPAASFEQPFRCDRDPIGDLGRTIQAFEQLIAERTAYVAD